MADTVQYFLEEMVPELRQLLKRGIFTEEEVRMIAKQRRTFEYRLKSKNVELADYMRYIEYELNLNKLRRVRMRQKDMTKKSEVAKYSGTKRIHFLFIRALKMFHQHIPLWQQHIRFCVASGSTRSLNKTFSRVLQLHPLEEQFWVQAAFWEYRQNQNILAARSLLQRAIRTIPNCHQVWLEYVRLELLYWKKVKDRLSIMGIKGAALVPKKAEGVTLPESDQEPAKEVAKTDDLGEESPFMAGLIPQIVYDNAIAQYGDDLDFRMEFLALFEEFPGTEHLREHIMSTLKADFGGNAQCAAYLAKRPLAAVGAPWENSTEQKAALKQCRRAFNAMLEEGATAAIYEELGSMYAGLVPSATSSAIARSLVEEEIAAYAEARSKELVSEKLMRAWMDGLMVLGDVDGAKSVAIDAVNLFPTSAALWAMAIKLSIRLLASNEEQPAVANRMVEQLFDAAFEAVDSSEDKTGLWCLHADFAAASHASTSVIEKRFRSLLLEATVATDPAKTKYLQVAHLAYGVSLARRLYDLAFKFPPAGLGFYKAVAAMEMSQREVEVDRVRQVFERAVDDRRCQHDVALWVSYARFEEDQGNFDRCSNVQWKAKQVLADPAAFASHFAE